MPGSHISLPPPVCVPPPPQVPRELRDQLASALRESDIPVPESEERWELALQALKGVWASKYNDRCEGAKLSRHQDMQAQQRVTPMCRW